MTHPLIPKTHNYSILQIIYMSNLNGKEKDKIEVFFLLVEDHGIH